MRKCKNCGWKSDSEFFNRISGYVSKLCKECERKAARDRRRLNYLMNKKKIQEQNAAWRDANFKYRASKFREKYAKDDKFRQLIKYTESDEVKKFLQEFASFSDLVEFIRRDGYLPEDESIESICRELDVAEISDPLPQSYIGLGYLDNIFTHRFRTRTSGYRSFHDCFYDDVEMYKIIKYITSSNRIPTKKLVIQNLKFSVKLPAHFFPSSATAVYREFAFGKDVFDPYLGWGGRTLGALCAGVNSIVGTDIQPESVTGCDQISDRFNIATHFIVGNCLQFMSDTHRKFDLVFTSPPFLDNEEYGQEACRTSEDWVKSTVVPLVIASVHIIKPDGLFAVHVQDRPKVPVLSAFLACFSGAGFTVEHEFKYGKRKGQKVIIFRRPS